MRDGHDGAGGGLSLYGGVVYIWDDRHKDYVEALLSIESFNGLCWRTGRLIDRYKLCSSLLELLL
jgi:hypothetical protein